MPVPSHYVPSNSPSRNVMQLVPRTPDRRNGVENGEEHQQNGHARNGAGNGGDAEDYRNWYVAPGNNPAFVAQTNDEPSLNEKLTMKVMVNGVKKDVLKVAGRICAIELQDFMCHSKMKLAFDTDKYNSFYIHGPNGSGKSAIFAAFNLGLGGKAKTVDRGNRVSTYVKEGRTSAKIRITLTNDGLNAHKSYAEKVVIERKIGTSTSYSLKSLDRNGRETVISERRADLDALLQHFGIDLENPLSWLSQDRSRQFLQDWKPKKLYEASAFTRDQTATLQIFMLTSELQLAAEIYMKVDVLIYEIKHNIGQGKEERERMKNEYNSMKTRFDAGKNLSEKKKELSKLCWLLLWTPIRDKEKEIFEEEGRLQKIVSLKEANDTELENETARKAEVEAERAGKATVVQQLRAAYTTARDETAAREAAKKQTEHDLRQSVNNVSKKKQRIEEVQNEITQLNEQLQTLLGDSQRDLASEYEQAREQKETIDQRLADLNGQQRKLDAEEEQLEASANAKNAAVQGLEYEKRTMEHQLSKLQREKHTLEQTRKDRMSRFGADVPRILQMIQQNARRFREMPIGPIGNFVTMKDPKWAAPVEYHLRKSLGAFLCSNSEDRKTFEELLRNMRVQQVPDIIVTKFTNRPHDTRQYEPPRNYPTILRVLDVSHPVAFNTLVDNDHIEQIVLFESDEDARRVMSQNPPQNVMQALTMSCCQVYPKMASKPYRYFYNNPWHPRMLAEGSASFARNFDAEIHGLQEQLRGFEQQMQQARNEAKHAANQFTAFKNRRDALHNEIRATKRQQKDAEDELENIEMLQCSGERVENLRQAVDENKNTKAQLEGELEELKAQCREAKERHREAMDVWAQAKQRVDAAKQRISDAENDMSGAADAMDECNNVLRRLSEKAERLARKVRENEERVVKLKQERDEAQRVCDAEKERFVVPDEYDDPPDFNLLPESAVLQDARRKLEREQAVIEQAAGQEIPTAEEVNCKYVDFHKHKAKLAKWKDVYKRLREVVKQRINKLEFIKKSHTRKIQRVFARQMNLRQYHGALSVDHQNGEINIGARTHKEGDGPRNAHEANGDEFEDDVEAVATLADDDDEQEATPRKKSKQVVQDLRGLSGGERSFTTACFVVALWECLETPFRCLDEFDVFMDMLNRRIAMEMLNDHCDEKREKQFFFFTPQGIQELKSHENIQVFELPKVRDA